MSNNNKPPSLIKKKMIKNKVKDVNRAILKIPITLDDIHLCFGPDVIKNNKGNKKGANIKL